MPSSPRSSASAEHGGWRARMGEEKSGCCDAMEGEETLEREDMGRDGLGFTREPSHPTAAHNIDYALTLTGRTVHDKLKRHGSPSLATGAHAATVPPTLGRRQETRK
ncbi:Os01g0806250 [Oryza sativa Japonica Group]|uniref:Os01g0806250 protein n=1 Tax=Oryza sativa subsp. japonica TaxID=39947 RepID=A0A0P0V9D6_ORYSJ|nr:Os01g0806250 [Oryza sativa Japonica Group]